MLLCRKQCRIVSCNTCVSERVSRARVLKNVWARGVARSWTRATLLWSVSSGRATRGRAPFILCGCPVCVGFCRCCTFVYLFPWRDYQFYRGRARARARADPRILRLIREDRVVFVSVYALGVCTSASGLWHFFRLFKHLANLHERD